VLDYIARRAITAATPEDKQRWEIIIFLASPMLLLQRKYVAREDISSVLLKFLRDESIPHHAVISNIDRTYTKIDRARTLIERENTSKALIVLEDVATFAPAAGLREKLQQKVLYSDPPPPKFAIPDKSRATLPIKTCRTAFGDTKTALGCSKTRRMAFESGIGCSKTCRTAFDAFFFPCYLSW
jgi:hypothetical protein